MTLTGLTSEFSYDILIYGSRGNNGGTNVFTVTDGNGTSSQNTDAFENSADVASFTSLAADGSGEITIVFETTGGPNGSNEGALGVMQITATSIPEPSVVLLGALGGLSLLRRRR